MKKILYLTTFLLIAHLIGMQGLYYSTWYYDDILHFMGGFTVAVMAFVFFPKIKVKTNFINIFIFIVLVAFLWELHEYLWDLFLVKDYGFPIMQLGIKDTISDFLLALVGGFVYYFIINRRINTGNKCLS